MKKYTAKILCTVLSAVLATSAMPLFSVSAKENVAESYTCKIGDSTLDGKINITDATHIQRISAELVKPKDGLDIDYYLSAFFADVNGDKQVNVKDATEIQKYCAGYDATDSRIDTEITVTKNELLPNVSTDDEISTGDEISTKDEVIFDGEKSVGTFSFDLFKTAYKNENNTGKNNLISPLSAIYALAMVTNGADGNTYKQLADKITNNGEIGDLNAYLLEYANTLKSNEYSKVSMANSVWNNSNEKRNHPIIPQFNETLGKYYSTELYSRDFEDENTLNEINSWCSDNTDGMIKEILSELPKDAVMALVNALFFEAKWIEQYCEYDVNAGNFVGFDKTSQAEYLHGSDNGGTYISDDSVTGFCKQYEGGYSFVAIMPNESGEKAFNDMIITMDYNRFLSLYKNQKGGEGYLVTTSMPKFKGEYSYEMKDILEDMGITDAFEPGIADFSKIYADNLPTFISTVTHKTAIENTEVGTKAAAVTAIIQAPTCEPYDNIVSINLDRPFMYAIVNSSTGTPLFIGTITSL
ncbi:MAG: serpin family protein [Acutalibacteraceae bacterium]